MNCILRFEKLINLLNFAIAWVGPSPMLLSRMKKKYEFSTISLNSHFCHACWNCVLLHYDMLILLICVGRAVYE